MDEALINSSVVHYSCCNFISIDQMNEGCLWINKHRFDSESGQSNVDLKVGIHSFAA